MPRTGLPEPFASYGEYQRHVRVLVADGGHLQGESALAGKLPDLGRRVGFRRCRRRPLPRRPVKLPASRSRNGRRASAVPNARLAMFPEVPTTGTFVATHVNVTAAWVVSADATSLS